MLYYISERNIKKNKSVQKAIRKRLNRSKARANGKNATGISARNNKMSPNIFLYSFIRNDSYHNPPFVAKYNMNLITLN